MLFHYFFVNFLIYLVDSKKYSTFAASNKCRILLLINIPCDTTRK